MMNLFNELGRRDQLRDLPSILSFSCYMSVLNNFNDTGARMLDYICTSCCYGHHYMYISWQYIHA